MTALQVAIVADHTVQRGGAERVTLSMLDAFPGAPLYTSVYDPAWTYPEYRDHDVRALALDRVPGARRHHRMAMPLFPATFGRTTIDADVVICSSAGWSHGVRTSGVKMVYCHNPPRWLYQAEEYLPPGRTLQRRVLSLLTPYLRRWDERAARSAASYLANSSVVKERIRSAYGIEATLLFPPHTLGCDGPVSEVPGIQPGYFLCIARLLAYKNVDVVVAAMAGLPSEHLVVVGSGPEEQRLRASAPSNVTFLGKVDDAEIRWLYGSCRALVASSFEDFGLTPLEAASFGKPSVVLRWGGFLDTTVEGTTGIFFDQPSVPDVTAALSRALRTPWDTAAIRAHAGRFTEEAFQTSLRHHVARCVG